MVDSLSSAASYATSGLAAADLQVAAAAANIANQNDEATPPASAVFGSSAVAAPLTGTQPSGAASQVFQALQVTETAPAGGGVEATLSRSSAYGLAYQPDSPVANAEGLVATPAVDPARQAVDLVTAANSFAANVETLRVVDRLEKRTLDIVS